MMIPYMAGISEDVRCICRKFGFRVVFKSGYTLRPKLTRVKDKLYQWRRNLWFSTIFHAVVASSTLER